MATIAGVLARPSGYTGVWSWITTVDHKRIGILYGFTAFAMFLIAGLEAGVMRSQLATADSDLISPGVFNQMFTMHATAMVFNVIMPLSASFFNLIVPLAIGARDVALPRLNAFSYWAFLFGALLMHSSFLVNQVPDAGWFSYANLTEKPFSGNNAMDFWALGLQVLGISSLAAGFNFIEKSIVRRPQSTGHDRIDTDIDLFGGHDVGAELEIKPAAGDGKTGRADKRGIEGHLELQ